MLQISLINQILSIVNPIQLFYICYFQYFFGSHLFLFHSLLLKFFVQITISFDYSLIHQSISSHWQSCYHKYHSFSESVLIIFGNLSRNLKYVCLYLQIFELCFLKSLINIFFRLSFLNLNILNILSS